MTREAMHGAGLGLMVWLGWLIPFHRLPLPEHYASIALALALMLAVPSTWLRRERRFWAVSAIIAAMALLILSLNAAAVMPARWLGPVMLVCAFAGIVQAAFALTGDAASRVALGLRDLAAGCVVAVALLMPFLSVARLRMPILTALAMLLITATAHRFARRTQR